jgi:hypothetical protein
MNAAQTDLLSASRLKADRGWTDALVKRFLRLPDDLSPNPYWHAGPAVRLYRRDRIEAIEAGAEFVEAKERAAVRQAASRKAITTKRSKALEWLSAAPGPILPRMPRADVVRLAADWFNRTYAFADNSDRWASPNDPEGFLNQIAVDWIRRQLGPYETKLRQSIGRQIDDQADRLIDGKILGAIAAACPWLKEECAARVRAVGLTSTLSLPSADVRTNGEEHVIDQRK